MSINMKCENSIQSVKQRNNSGKDKFIRCCFIIKICLFMLLASSVIVPNLSMAAYQSVIGIPDPPFGVTQNRPEPPSPWNSEQAGYYYVDANASNSSDSNTYGYPGKARRSIPNAPSAGSIVFINGTYPDGESLSGSGTSAKPIWYTAYNTSSKPTIQSPWEFSGSYIIADNLDFSHGYDEGISFKGSHNVLRYCSLKNTYDNDNGSGIGAGGSYNVIYKSTIGPIGDWKYDASDIDRHGIKVVSGANNLWVLYSTFYNCMGDGIQVGDQNNAASAINRIFIGGNVAHDNLQTGFWVKNASDVIFSQNTLYNHTVSNYGPGAGLGGQYDAKYIWFIFNKIYSSTTGIGIMGTGNGGGGPWYVLGNLIYDIDNANSCNPYNYGAIVYRNDGGIYISHNTMYDNGVYVATVNAESNSLMRSNLFASPKSQSCPNFNMSGNYLNTMDYNLYDTNNFKFGSTSVQYNTVSDFASSRSQESHRQVGNPYLSDPPSDFSISNASSPAIANAYQSTESAYSTFFSRYGVSIEKDYVGDILPNDGSIDIGAYEEDSSGGTTVAAPKNLIVVPPQ